MLPGWGDELLIRSGLCTEAALVRPLLVGLLGSESLLTICTALLCSCLICGGTCVGECSRLRPGVCALLGPRVCSLLGERGFLCHRFLIWNRSGRWIVA